MRAVGSYLIERELGRGATAQVFRAQRPGDSGPVALKVFYPGLWEHEGMRRRAMGEFRTISALKHPNIIQVREALWENDPPAVVMELVDGMSLEQFQGRLPYILPEVAVLILVKVLSALEHAHAQGVVHRDLKPENILISDDGQVLVSDFGLAQMKDVSRHTMSGTLLGSPDYMSPEQARGDRVAPQSDLFSAASILYFLVTGTRPFRRPSLHATIAAVIESNVEPAQRRNPKLSSRLSALIQRGLEKKTGDRFESATEFKDALEKYLAEMGLSPECFSFNAWMACPSEVTLGAMKAISDHCIYRCEHLLAEGNLNQAVEALSQLGMVAPESAAIPRLMDDLQARRRSLRRRKVLFPSLVAGLALVVGAIAGTLFLTKTQPVTVAQTRAAPQAEVPVPQETPTAEETPLETVVQKTVSDSIRVRRAAPQTEVRFEIPEGISVFWDGQKVDPAQMLKGQRVGSHELRLERTGARPIVAPVDVKLGEPTVIRVQ